jgi:hypothetical protein
MSRTRNRSFKGELARELRGLADILLSAGLLRDTSPLAAAASMCTGNPTHVEWNYECLSLSFVVNDHHLGSYRRTIPGKLREIVIELSVRAKGFCTELYDNLTDPFISLAVDCRIEGRKRDGPPFFCAWHLDRNEGDNTEEESKNFVHPCYHFQFGGNQLPQELGYGRLLLVESPRIAHPPLDAILAVDFVLSNYFSTVWQDLRQDERYPRIVQQAQRRFWLPYAEASIRGKGWGSSSEDASWNVRDIWPQIILPD